MLTILRIWQLTVLIETKNGLFSVLNLNAQSLPAKFDGLQAMLELFASEHIYFPVICIQETWIGDEYKLPMVSIEGYEYFYVNHP